MLFLLLATTVDAQPTDGKIYRFENSKANPGYYMASVFLTRSSIKPGDESDYSQLWYIAEHPSNSNAWTLRNLGNGRYLQHAATTWAGSNPVSNYWTFVDDAASATALYYIDRGDGYCTLNNSKTLNFPPIYFSFLFS